MNLGPECDQRPLDINNHTNGEHLRVFHVHRAKFNKMNTNYIFTHILNEKIYGLP